MRLLLAALVVLVAGCASSAGAPPVRAARKAPAMTPSTSAATPVQLVPEVGPRKDARREAVLNAWALWASGDVEAARASLHVVALGPTDVAGLGALHGFVVRGAHVGAQHGLSFTGSKENGAVFFDAESGAPQSFRPVTLVRGMPALVSPYFIVDGGVLDATAGTLLELPGPLVAAFPDGTRVVVFDQSLDKATGDPRCKLIEWSLLTRATIRTLATPALEGRCDPYELRDAVVTRSATWLTTRLGRISLRGGGIVPLPAVTKGPYLPAVSPDGGAIVHIVTVPHRDPAATANVTRLAATDLDTGVTRYARSRLSVLTNSDPLTRLVDPPGICLSDYSVHAFSWPSLEETHAEGWAVVATRTDEWIETEDGARRVPLGIGCRDQGTQLATLPAATKVAAQLCMRGGFVLPRALCD